MNVFIRCYNDQYHWFAISPSQPVLAYEGSLAELGDFYRENNQVKSWVLIAPALNTAERIIHFSEKERKHITKAIPFLLEDDLLTEAPDLHFVSDKLSANAIDVVAIDKALLTAWLKKLASVGVKPTHCLPEVKLLLDGAAEWQVFYRHGEFIVKPAQGECVAIEQEHFTLMVELLTENYAKLPSSIELIVEDEAGLNVAWEYVPAAIQALIEAKTLPYAEMLQDRFSQQAKIWNLLKGSFAYTQQWLSVLLPWRWVGLVFFIVAVLQITINITEYQQAYAENKRLRAEMEAVFREAIPRGQIVDHRKQLQNELDTLQRGGGSGDFMQKMQKIGSVFAKHEIQTFNALNYEQAKNEIRIDLLVMNYDKLQEVITELQQIGLTVDIQNSNAQGELLRARIKVTG
jgi:type II secretion system protein L